RVIWCYSATLGEFRGPFLNGAQRSVNRKVQGSNPCPGANVHLTKIGDTRGVGPLAQTLVGSLTSEPAVWTVEVVKVLPLLESLVEELGVVDHNAFQLSVELLIIDAV